MKRRHEQKYLGIPSVNHYTYDNKDGELIYKGHVFPEAEVQKRMQHSYKAASKKPTEEGFRSWAKRNAMYALHVLETLMVSGAYIEYFL